MSVRELKLHLEEKLEEMAEILAEGKHIEIHLSKDGIKCFAVDKKIVK